MGEKGRREDDSDNEEEEGLVGGITSKERAYVILCSIS